MVTYNRGPERVVKVTKDTVAIVEELGVHYPAVKTISEAAKMHRVEVGDGVASFMILLSGLLRGAEKMLLNGVHPNVVLQGYREAALKALGLVDEVAAGMRRGSLEEALRVVDCGRGLLTEEFSRMLVEASRLAVKDGRVDKDRVRIARKIGGVTGESRLIRGVVIKKDKVHPDMVDEVVNPRIALVNGRVGVKRLEVKMKGEGRFPVELNIQDPVQIKAFKAEERRLKMQIVERLKSLDVNVLICSQLIDDDIQGELARRGVFALMSVEREDLDAVSEATGARVMGDLDDLSEADVGGAERLEVGEMEPEKIVTLSGCEGVTLLLRGSTPQVLDEFEKVVRCGISVLSYVLEDGRMVPGGGAVEMHLAEELRRFSLGFSGKAQLAIQSFADALEEIPRCLAENNGLNPLDTVLQLKNYHVGGQFSFGVGVDGCSDMVGAGVMDLASVKKSILKRAYEVASLMLRIDDLIVARETAKVHTQ